MGSEDSPSQSYMNSTSKETPSSSSSSSSPPPTTQQRSSCLNDDAFENDIQNDKIQEPTNIRTTTTKNPIQLFLHRTKVLYTQLTTSEISGSLGDLGTLIPLLVTMSRQRSVLLAPALFFAGLANIITGYTWDVPMCVQPMKSIAAVAISEGLSQQSVTTAGILTGGMIFAIGLSNFIEVVNVIVPGPVVSGLQMGVGLRLASKGMRDVEKLGWVDDYDCILLAVICAVLCLYWLREQPVGPIREPRHASSVMMMMMPSSSSQSATQQRTSSNRVCAFFGRIYHFFKPKHQHPIGIYLFLIGVIFAIIALATANPADSEYDLPLTFFGAPVAVWAMEGVTSSDWKTGLLEGAIPQIPLTTLNSVISVCCLAHSLYPEKRKCTSSTSSSSSSTDAVIGRREVSISVGLMNLLMCPFGAMPNCHGAGGLAGQHRLGARHGSSVVFLGVAKVLLAVFFGKSALTLLDALPTAVLGVMLAIAGQELTTTGFGLLVTSVDEDVDAQLSLSTDVDAGDDCDQELNNDDNNEERKNRRKTLFKKLLRKKTVIATITCAVIVALGKTHYGALSGWVVHMIYGDGMTDFMSWCQRKYDAYRGHRRHHHNENVQEEEEECIVEEGLGKKAAGSVTSSGGSDGI